MKFLVINLFFFRDLMSIVAKLFSNKPEVAKRCVTVYNMQGKGLGQIQTQRPSKRRR